MTVCSDYPQGLFPDRLFVWKVRNKIGWPKRASQTLVCPCLFVQKANLFRTLFLTTRLNATLFQFAALSVMSGMTPLGGFMEKDFLDSSILMEKKKKTLQDVDVLTVHV